MCSEKAETHNLIQRCFLFFQLLIKNQYFKSEKGHNLLRLIWSAGVRTALYTESKRVVRSLVLLLLCAEAEGVVWFSLLWMKVSTSFSIPTTARTTTKDESNNLETKRRRRGQRKFTFLAESFCTTPFS